MRQAGDDILFYDALFEIFGEVGPHFCGGAFAGHFCHVRVGHQFHQLFETGFGRVPSEMTTRLGRISEQIDNIRRICYNLRGEVPSAFVEIPKGLHTQTQT